MKQIEKDLLKAGRKAGYKGKKLLGYVNSVLSGAVEAIEEAMEVPLKKKKK